MGCLTCVARVGMTFLVILNLLTLLLGVGILVVGIVLRKNVAKETDIMNFLDEIRFGTVSLKEIINVIFGVVIILGVFTSLMSLSGCVGAICKVRVLLIIYIILLVVCILLELVILGFWVAILKGVDRWLSEEFNSLLKKYNGVLAEDVFSLGWNVIFMTFSCCGVQPVSSTRNDFQALPSEWWGSELRGADVIPRSCCENATTVSVKTRNINQCTQDLQNYHTAGCYDVFRETFTKLARAGISLVVIIVVTEITAMIFGILITHYENTRKKHERPNPSQVVWILQNENTRKKHERSNPSQVV